jgi:hypothetical protein
MKLRGAQTAIAAAADTVADALICPINQDVTSVFTASGSRPLLA